MRTLLAAPGRLLFALLLAACLGLPCLPPQDAQAKKPAAQAEEPPQAEPVNISGRIMVGLDKTFIKAPDGGLYLVQGLDLTPYAGRHIQAQGVLLRQEQDYRTVRLLNYRIQSPDDDSPGAGGAVQQPGKGAKKKIAARQAADNLRAWAIPS